MKAIGQIDTFRFSAPLRVFRKDRFSRLGAYHVVDFSSSQSYYLLIVGLAQLQGLVGLTDALSSKSSHAS